jgi:uncharacterized membrane protein
MRIVLVMIGLCLVLISIPGYLDTPNLMSQMIHSFTSSFTGSIPGTSGGSMLHQMGYPSRTVIIPLIQYSFVGLAAVGIGFVGFGSVAKKIPKQVTVKLVTEEAEKVKEVHTSPQITDERTQTNLRSLRILQERLAKGEITSSEFQNLKRLLE